MPQAETSVAEAGLHTALHVMQALILELFLFAQHCFFRRASSIIVPAVVVLYLDAD